MKLFEKVDLAAYNHSCLMLAIIAQQARTYSPSLNLL